MSLRNRIVSIAIALAAALFLAAPAPSRAAGLWEEPISIAGAVERFWSWVTGLWPDGGSSEPTTRWEKEGGMINPNGQPNTAPPPASSAPGDPDS